MRRKVLKKKEQEALGSFLGVLILIAILIGVGKHVIKFLSTNYEIFYFILGATGIVLVGLFRREQIKRKNYLKFVEEWRNYLFTKLKEHEKTLGIKRNQTLRKNSYGFIDQKQKNEWEKEVSTFLVSIQFPSPSLFASVEIEEFFDLINKISEESANNLVYDAEKVTPKEYEVMCADILKNAGWDANITKASGDQGVDVVAEKNFSGLWRIRLCPGRAKWSRKRGTESHTTLGPCLPETFPDAIFGPSSDPMRSKKVFLSGVETRAFSSTSIMLETGTISILSLWA